MKVIYCPFCNDLMKLTRAEVRSCKCGRVKGAYNQDGDTVWYNGVGRLYGVNNKDLALGVKDIPGDAPGGVSVSTSGQLDRKP